MFTILPASALGFFAALQSPEHRAGCGADRDCKLPGSLDPDGEPAVGHPGGCHSLSDRAVDGDRVDRQALAMLTVLVRYQVPAARAAASSVFAEPSALLESISWRRYSPNRESLDSSPRPSARLQRRLLAGARAFWPDASFGAWPQLLPGAAIVGTVLLAGGLSPIRFLRARYLRDQEPGVVPLGFPTFQLAISLTLFMGSALLPGKARSSR
jgi:hypothetical protein